MTGSTRHPVTDRIGPFVVWVALAAFAVWAARDLGFGSLVKPGPALFPVSLSVIIAVLAIADLVLPGDRAGQGGERVHAEERNQLRMRRGLVLLGVVLFAVLLPYLGTVLVSVLLMMFLLVAVEKQPVPKSLAISIGTALGMYALLAVAFGVPLPNGPLEGWF